MKNNWEDNEPGDEELKEIEELLHQMEEEEGKEDTLDWILSKRVFFLYEDFEVFKRWLGKNGIKWE